MATVKLFHATGFTSTNLPFALSVIDKRAKSVTTVEGVDIIQVYGLTSIRVAADESAILDVDYCSIEDGTRKAYYAVTGYVMTSIDVAALDIVLDPFSSLGGWDTLTVEGGMIIRSNIKSQYERYFSGEDPYLIQTQPPIYSFTFVKIGEDDQPDYDVVALTVNPSSATTALKELYKITGTVAEDGSVDYNVDKPTSLTAPHATRVPLSMSFKSYPLEYDLTTAGYGLFELNNDVTSEGIAALYSLGMQDAIIGAYRIPGGLYHSNRQANGYINELAFTSDGDVDFPYNPHISPTNNKYSDIDEAILNRLSWAKNGILSVSNGQKLEHRYSEASNKIFVTGLMQPDGYMIFAYPPTGTDNVKTGDTDGFADRFAMLKFWAITSDTWTTVPMVASGIGSGKAIAQMQANQAAGDMRLQYQQEIQRGENDLRRVSNIANFAGSIASGDIGSAISSAIGFASSEQAVQLSERSMQQAREIRSREKANELAGYYADTYYKAPVVTGIETNHLQEYTKNKQLIAYIVRPSQGDMQRFNEIAKWFGLATSNSVLASGSKTIARNPDTGEVATKYQYIQTSGVKFAAKAGAPNYLIQAANDACNTGCRFWRE